MCYRYKICIENLFLNYIFKTLNKTTVWGFIVRTWLTLLHLQFSYQIEYNFKWHYFLERKNKLLTMWFLLSTLVQSATLYWLLTTSIMTTVKLFNWLLIEKLFIDLKMILLAINLNFFSNIILILVGTAVECYPVVVYTQ